jgi:hypothetical protein
MLSEIEDLANRYPDIPLEAVVKEELMRRGMAWSKNALAIAANFKCKAYSICSFQPLIILGKGQAAPLEYQVRLLRAYQDTRARYSLPTPAGYGEPGLAFMDVLPSLPQENA